MKTFKEFIEEEAAPSNVTGAPVATNNPKMRGRRSRRDDEEDEEDEEGWMRDIADHVSKKYERQIKKAVETLGITAANAADKQAQFVKKLQQAGMSYSDALMYFNRLVQLLGSVA